MWGYRKRNIMGFSPDLYSTLPAALPRGAILFACPKSNQKRHHAQRHCNFALALPNRTNCHANPDSYRDCVRAGRGQPRTNAKHIRNKIL
jgi:hypothetical protein